ncbi:SRPBCC family protein [Nocardia cyriacigeorgica]|uniref:SRPBCC family protein n=1 Tax=Nocardia cyriacigeorgica TaxID=135487 RepID=UPI0024558DC8|nr:SRPBCC family protein [Nocardia cyriacigeorgica]
MRFDRPLAIGAVGGHGPVRYHVESWQPGRWVRFRFTGPRGFDGFHEFTIHDEDDGTTTLRHLLAMRLHSTARLTWPLCYRWMHDALLEDALDRAELNTSGHLPRPARHSGYVRLLRALASRYT